MKKHDAHSFSEMIDICTDIRENIVGALKYILVKKKEGKVQPIFYRIPPLIQSVFPSQASKTEK
jgi:hypothetical protein